ncbi:AAA-like domain-containing protein [Anaerolineales bacterium HSG6]|nr:AAA-like domain-containing protein [Anaerolineales bacterium HSG6]
MKKFFNTSGPCWPDEHYMLPAQERCQGLLELIEQKQYFIIHAARQSGKTTLLFDLAKQLNESGDYYALYCSLESADKIVDPEKGIPAIVRTLRTQIQLDSILSQFPFAENIDYDEFNIILRVSLTYFCKSLDKPLVILFDEIDCLSNGTLISFLRQLRDGYVNRGLIPFVNSVALVGLRNIRDYKARVRDDRETLGSGSPFNIASDIFTLRNFYQEEVSQLYAQHTEQTGQEFPADVVETAYHYTQGQPWLTSAIPRQIVKNLLKYNYSQPITVDHVEQAAKTIIKRRDVHIDSLLERLKEERVERFVEPVITGEIAQYTLLDDDYQYVLDLGLLREFEGRLIPSNPIYGEVMLHHLTNLYYKEMEERRYPPTAPAYLVDGRLDIKRLLTDFQQFWRENSEIWQEKYQYKEAAPHLVMNAFMMRVANAGGRISRELGSGRGRLDLCLHYGEYRYPIELKIRYGDKTYEKGKKQIAGYMDKMGCTEGWLVVFDRRKRSTWSKKIFWRTAEVEGKIIHTVGC